MCNLEWVTMEDVENLWANFVLEAIGAGEKHQSEMATTTATSLPRR